MSAELIIRITEEAEKKELNMEVKAIVARLAPFIEVCLDGFERQVMENEKRSEEIEAAQQSRIITP